MPTSNCVHYMEIMKSDSIQMTLEPENMSSTNQQQSATRLMVPLPVLIISNTQICVTMDFKLKIFIGRCLTNLTTVLKPFARNVCLLG